MLGIHPFHTLSLSLLGFPVKRRNPNTKQWTLNVRLKLSNLSKPMLEVTFRQTPHAQSAYGDTGAFKSLNPKYTVKRGKIVTQSIRELP
jgi:hypothetical protein